MGRVVFLRRTVAVQQVLIEQGHEFLKIFIFRGGSGCVEHGSKLRITFP